MNENGLANSAPSSVTHSAIPDFFRPVLWSYDITRLDAKKDKELLITHAINYGNLQHWRWIATEYGRDTVRAFLEKTPVDVLRPRVRRLAALVFDIQAFNHAQRGA